MVSKAMKPNEIFAKKCRGTEEGHNLSMLSIEREE